MIRKAVCLSMLGLVVLVTGCPAGDSDTVNFFSAVSKIAANPSDPPIGSLTAAEWKAVSAKLSEFAPLVGLTLPEGITIPVLTDEQAQDIVDFLDANGVETVSDLKALDLDSVVLPDSLRELANAFGADLD